MANGQKIPHRNIIRKAAALILYMSILNAASLFAQNTEKTSLTAESFIDWKTGVFSSSLALDMNAAGFPLPAGRTAGINRIRQQLPLLVKSPLLTVTLDSSSLLGNAVTARTLALEDLTDIIDTSSLSPGIYGREDETLKTEHRISLYRIAQLMVAHKVPYTPTIPIEQVSSRPYTGIIIDARGNLPVHGEFTREKANACLFPKIWDSGMDLLYERNMAEPEVVRTKGLVSYGSVPDAPAYEKRIGKDPLYIAAKEVFGVYRTDPVISRTDALKILSIPENRELLRLGKVVIVLNEDALAYRVASPVKDKNYYFDYNRVEEFIADNKIPDVEISDAPPGMLISVRNLKFKADSAVLLQDEKARLDLLAESLKKATAGNENTILVEGHTASVGKAQGEKLLSVQRAQAIIAEMVKRGVDEKLFTYRGYGGTRPIGDNATEEGRAQNRRVEITVIPKATYIQRIN